MKLSIGIVGLPNVGKSTLFKLLTKNEVHIANYPFATIDPNIGVVSVPDERLDILCYLSSSNKKIPAVIEFYDIAGLVKGANQGQGLGNQFLSHIRETEAIIQVVRCFYDPTIIHVENNPNPLRDIETINTELILKDLETIKKRIEKLESEARSGNKEKAKELSLLKRVEDFLNKETLLFLLDEEILNHPSIKNLNLLTAKKMIFLLNGEEKDVSFKLKEKINQLQSPYLIFNLKKEPDLSPLIKEAYKILDLISFFTTGEEETRAWTIKKGWKAPQAAGVIHTDFENKFIRAEVIFWKDLVEAGGWNQARQKGLIRIEGKDYIVQDGDVLFIRHG